MKNRLVDLVASPATILLFVAAIAFSTQTENARAQIFTGQQITGGQTTGYEALGGQNPNIVSPSNTSLKEYVPLVEIPGLTTPDALENDLVGFWNAIYRLCIGAAVVLAIVQIMRGGLLYMTNDSPIKISDGKSLIWQSIIGLVLVLSPVLVLGIINPSIVGLELVVEPVQKGTGSLRDIVPGQENSTVSGNNQGSDTTTPDPSTEPSGEVEEFIVDGIRVQVQGTYLKTAFFTDINGDPIRLLPLNSVVGRWMDTCSSAFVASKASTQSHKAEAQCGVFYPPLLFVVPNATVGVKTQVQVLPGSKTGFETFRDQCALDGGVAFIPISKPRIQIKDLTPQNAFTQLDACPAEVSQMGYPSHYIPECYRASPVCWSNSSTDRKFLVE